MMTRFLLLLLLLLLPVPCFATETFGLGDAPPELVAAVSGETFGLTNGVGVVRERVVVRQERQPVTPVRSLVPVVRRATGDWVDAAVGAWDRAKLAAHLRGELASAQHRGTVPLEQLVGRTLRELRDIHDNLHEGWAWDGSARTRKVVVTQKTLQVQSGGCPGGVCPLPTRGRLFRR